MLLDIKYFNHVRKVRQQTAANATVSYGVTSNKNILKECRNLYTDHDNGLIHIAEDLVCVLLTHKKNKCSVDWK